MTKKKKTPFNYFLVKSLRLFLVRPSKTEKKRNEATEEEREVNCEIVNMPDARSTMKVQ